MVMNSIERKTADEERQDLLRALGRRVKEFTTLHEVTQIAIESLDLDEILNIALKRVAELMEVEVAAIFLANDQEGNIIGVAHGDISQKFLNSVKERSISYAITNRLALWATPVVVEDVSKYPELADISVRQEGLRSIAAIPLKSNDKVIGTLVLGSHDLHSFSSEDIQLLAILGEGLGPALRNAELYRALQEKVRQLAAYNDELLRRQQELIEKTREAEAATRVKSEFLARVSHELRTPLNSIIGFSELMLDGVPGQVNEEQRQCLDDILTSGRHLLYLVNEVLDLSKIESGKTELRLTDLNLTDVLESVRHIVMRLLAPRKQTLDVIVEERLPRLYADEDRLKQVLLNLLSNASKFSPDGSKVKVEAVKKGDWCQVSVIDKGIGIKEEEKQIIFEPLYHLADTLREGNSATGLGLAIVRQIVEKHGGRIWVESEYGKGSQFIFTLPLRATESDLNSYSH